MNKIKKKVNSRNDSLFFAESSDVASVLHMKFLVTVMVLVVVNNEEYVMPRYIFAQGLRVNSASYIDILEIIVKPWIDAVCKGRRYLLQ